MHSIACFEGFSFSQNLLSKFLLAPSKAVSALLGRHRHGSQQDSAQLPGEGSGVVAFLLRFPAS